MRKLKDIWIFYFGPLLSIPLIAFLCLRGTRSAIGERRERLFVSAILLAMVIALLQTVWFYPHYASPAFAAFLAMLVFGLRGLRSWRWRGRPTGLFLSRAIPLGCAAMTLLPICAQPLGWRLSEWPLQWATGSPPQVHRASIESRILAGNKRALVFVDYSANHDPANEWVYNSPDIEDQLIIWARRVSPASDAALIRHFHDHSIWLIKPDAFPIVLTRCEQP
jgi:hypothetical protein